MDNECSISKKERDYLTLRRTALLAEVDAIEEYLDMVKTSDVRRWAKDHGAYEVLALCEKDKQQ